VVVGTNEGVVEGMNEDMIEGAIEGRDEASVESVIERLVGNKSDGISEDENIGLVELEIMDGMVEGMYEYSELERGFSVDDVGISNLPVAVSVLLIDCDVELTTVEMFAVEELAKRGILLVAISILLGGGELEERIVEIAAVLEELLKELVGAGGTEF
jgi:hypothetical protein